MAASTAKSKPSPERIFNTMVAFQETEALKAAIELDIFTAIAEGDRKSTRLNSSHGYISYAVFCLKKKKQQRVKNSHAMWRTTSTQTTSSRPPSPCVSSPPTSTGYSPCLLYPLALCHRVQSSERTL